MIFICILPAKEKEIAILQQTLSGRDKKITDLKEKLSQLQKNGQRNNFDFAEQMETMDKKLQEAKKNIAEFEAGVIFNVMKNEMEAKESQSEPKAFNGEYTRRDGDHAVNTTDLSSWTQIMFQICIQ